MPYERFGVGVRRCQVLLNGGNQLGDALEAATPYSLLGQLPEPPLHQVQPRRTRRDEVEGEPRVLVQPCPHAGLGVGPVVVQDQMEGGFLPETPGPAAAGSVRTLGDGAWACTPRSRIREDIQEIKGRKQGGGPVPLIVVGHRPTTSLFHGQAGLTWYAGAPGFGSSRPRIAPQLCRED